MQSRVSRYGIPADELDGFAAVAEEAFNSGADYEYSIHTDDAFGVALTVTATCSGQSYCTVVDELGLG
jgi:hypothetical protein